MLLGLFVEAIILFFIKTVIIAPVDIFYMLVDFSLVSRLIILAKKVIIQ